MDLTRFTKDKSEEKKEIILDNDEITVTKIGENVEFFLKKKEALAKYKDFLFFSPTNAMVTDSDEKAQEFFETSLAEGVEGLMFKSLETGYKPGVRAGSMAKLKETKEDLDVVILAAEYGSGKRGGYYTSFHVGVRDEDAMDDENAFLEVGKVSSGIKELGDVGASMENLTNLLKPLKISESNGIVQVEPKIVIQVRYQEIQKSTTYSSGYALRFPRIISLREDKTVEEINTIEDVSRFA